MNEKIKIRLDELKKEYEHLTDYNIYWFKSNGGLTRNEQIIKCKYLIDELENLIKEIIGKDI